MTTTHITVLDVAQEKLCAHILNLDLDSLDNVLTKDLRKLTKNSESIINTMPEGRLRSKISQAIVAIKSEINRREVYKFMNSINGRNLDLDMEDEADIDSILNEFIV